MNARIPPQDVVNAAPVVPAPVRARICFARGDGIGPEIMDASLRVLEAAGARIDLHEIEVGARVWSAGHTSGIAPDSWDTLRRADAFYKAPVTTPSGGGVKSLNVTIRKSLGLYANVRPCRAWAPFVATRHPDMDVVIIRENEEDLYAGIEHRQTPEVTQCLKIVSRPGIERIVRYAFEHARRAGRRKVTCFTKDNIMKMTDGLFRRVFDEIGAEYPEIERDHMIIDIAAARLAARPESFDVIVTLNLYGDIVSDVAAEIAGSVGLAPSANIGENGAMFEAIHGSAPDIAGQDVANPSGLLLAGVEMLRHVGQAETAARVADAWACALEDGVRTADMGGDAPPVGTRAFADAVIARLGRTPRVLPPAARIQAPPLVLPPPKTVPRPVKTMDGVDMFLDWDGPGRDPDALARIVQSAVPEPLRLSMITNRGVKVWPAGFAETGRTDHWRCRLTASPGTNVTSADIVRAHADLARAGLDVIKIETLCAFDGERGYSLGQGQ